ncbi:MAG: leucine--tRNA ligase [Patescibacteria group bacterium]|nr:leucine--tRNA ligase [Patescibacteria group bacterium]
MSQNQKQAEKKQAEKTPVKYQHQSVETKWLDKWEQEGLFQDTFGDFGGNNYKMKAGKKKKKKAEKKKAAEKKKGKGAVKPEDKMYLLFAFAYPSGSGLHVGHVESKTALDIMARYNRMNGKDVFFPVGWDAFGLPAENYAVKTGVHPEETTKNAINTFRRQIKRVGISYDWANEIATSHPDYYQWTQWLFIQLFQNGLAYKDIGMVNWCPSCKTVLANEQVVEGLCERCDSEVMQKKLEQWYFKITDYKDELIEGLDEVDWPEATKRQQKNWIGRSEGANVDFEVVDSQSANQGGKDKNDNLKLTCFTTRTDTIFGVSFLVISPEKFKEFELEKYLAKDKFDEVEKYIKQAFKKTEEERQIGEKDKTGVNTGLKVINPVNGEEAPLFIADYVLGGVGTGVVMGVPAHDERDWAFAKKHNLSIKPVIKPQFRELKDNECFTDYGVMINSGDYTGRLSLEGREELVEDFSHVIAKTTTYKLRDWLISRQRYWGAPIPIIYDPDGSPHAIKDEDLPWALPHDVDFKPTGESPLKSSQKLIKRTHKYVVENFADLIAEHKKDGWAQDGSDWEPEFDTMDTFVDSSWYYLRYLHSRNKDAFSQEDRLNNWMPVDFYLIGPEHIVLHLLYSRFFTKFLRDQGYIDLENGEPFAKMRHQGMILGPDHKKMSKSKGNVINPDKIVKKYGADTLRVYEMFIGPLEADKPWDDRAVQGVFRFLHKMYGLVQDLADYYQTNEGEEVKTAAKLEQKLHQTIRKVGKDIPQLKFNTAIACMMEFSNEWRSWLVHDQAGEEEKNHPGLSLADAKKLVKILAPFAPFMAEEMWNQLGEKFSVHQQTWPEFDADLAQEEQAIIPVQVNGKLRGELILPAEVAADRDSEIEILTQAKELQSVQKWIKDKEIKKEIFVPGKIVSLVV